MTLYKRAYDDSGDLPKQVKNEIIPLYFHLLVNVNSENYQKTYAPDKAVIREIEVQTKEALKRSSNQEETKNIGYVYKYQRAQYFSCCRDLTLLREAKVAVTTIREEMGEETFKMLFQGFMPQRLMDKTITELEKKERRDQIVYPLAGVALLGTIAAVGYYFVSGRKNTQ